VKGKFSILSLFLVINTVGLCFAQSEYSSPSTSSLLRLLYSKDKISRDRAAYQLAIEGGEEARREFIHLIQTGDEALKETGIIGLATLEARDPAFKEREEEVSTLFYQQLKDKNWRIRQAGVIALGIIGDEQAIPLLEDIARNDPYYLKKENIYPVRKSALSSLSRIRKQKELKEIKAVWRKAEEAIGEEEWAEAISFFNQIIEKDKTNKWGFKDDASFGIGYVYAREGKYRKAIRVFKSILEDYPDFEKKEKVLYCLSLCYFYLREYRLAKESLQLLEKEFSDTPVGGKARVLLKKLQDL